MKKYSAFLLLGIVLISVGCGASTTSSAVHKATVVPSFGATTTVTPPIITASPSAPTSSISTGCPSGAKIVKSIKLPNGNQMGYCFTLVNQWFVQPGYPKDTATAYQDTLLGTSSNPEFSIEFIPFKLSIKNAGCASGQIDDNCVEQQCKAYITSTLNGTIEDNAEFSEGSNRISVG
jgi:hypothetical protein